MHLDILSLMATGSFITACAGLLLFFAWWQNRDTPALGLWAISYLIAAVGIATLMLWSALQDPIYKIIAGMLLALAPGLTWQAARALDNRTAPFLVVLLGLFVVAIATAVHAPIHLVASSSLAAGAFYYGAAAVSLWLGRADSLPARLPVALFLAAHALVLSSGMVSTLFGAIEPYELPPLFSVFGIIHFEAIIFALGTTVFVLALVKERREAVSQRAAKIDGLTGVANRLAFMEGAERALERCRLDNAPASLVLFDLDLFKDINDTHGHLIGDAVLRKFCEVVVKKIRGRDVFGRIGGEEFAVLLPGSSGEVAYARAERIRICFAECCGIICDHRVTATVSGGVATTVDGTSTLLELLELSDHALYGAKAQGRNRVLRAKQAELESGAPAIARIA